MRETGRLSRAAARPRPPAATPRAPSAPPPPPPPRLAQLSDLPATPRAGCPPCPPWLCPPRSPPACLAQLHMRRRQPLAARPRRGRGRSKSGQWRCPVRRQWGANRPKALSRWLCAASQLDLPSCPGRCCAATPPAPPSTGGRQTAARSRSPPRHYLSSTRPRAPMLHLASRAGWRLRRAHQPASTPLNQRGEANGTA
eukprot:scaffold1021_cov108-Isochrysis_galbana.AAC.3